MKYIFALILIAGGVFLGGETNAARFDWSNGQPAIVEDNVQTTHGTRYDWVMGIPTIVRTAPTAEADTTHEGQLEIKSGAGAVKGAKVQIK